MELKFVAVSEITLLTLSCVVLCNGCSLNRKYVLYHSALWSEMFLQIRCLVLLSCEVKMKLRSRCLWVEEQRKEET